MSETDGRRFRVCVVGGGPAGMAASWAAGRCGAQVTLVERCHKLGGVLPQCIHTGFGTQVYGADLTGGEYASLWEKKLREVGVRVITDATVTRICWDWQVWYADPVKGESVVPCDAIILATGCTERTLPQLDIPGSRPAGVFTAGAAQRMMNLYNMRPGQSAVILGSGDIGLIMARRMHLEGIEVKMVLGEKGSGLARNIVQCVQDFGIPLRYGWTVAETHGFDRLTGVTIRKIETGEEAFIACDTLLVAAGLVPDQTLLQGRGEEEGLYICGNADHVHDLVDQVSLQGVQTGLQACRDWLAGHPDFRHVPRDGSDPFPREVVALAEQKLPNSRGSMEGGNMVCTVCPKGCILRVQGAPFAVSGNECDRGEAFARQELETPLRVVTTVVKVEPPAAEAVAVARREQKHAAATVSVRTKNPVSKETIPQVMEAARKAIAPADAVIGDVISCDGYAFVVTGQR